MEVKQRREHMVHSRTKFRIRHVCLCGLSACVCVCALYVEDKGIELSSRKLSGLSADLNAPTFAATLSERQPKLWKNPVGTIAVGYLIETRSAALCTSTMLP